MFFLFSVNMAENNRAVNNNDNNDEHCQFRYSRFSFYLSAPNPETFERMLDRIDLRRILDQQQRQRKLEPERERQEQQPQDQQQRQLVLPPPPHQIKLQQRQESLLLIRELLKARSELVLVSRITAAEVTHFQIITESVVVTPDISITACNKKNSLCAKEKRPSAMSPVTLPSKLKNFKTWQKKGL